MKKFLFLATIALLAVACGGGSEENTDIHNVTASWKGDVDFEGSDYVVSFSAETKWEIVVNSEGPIAWVEFSDMEGKAGENSISISVRMNPDTNKRTCSFSIVSENGKKRNLNITQKANSVYYNPVEGKWKRISPNGQWREFIFDKNFSATESTYYQYPGDNEGTLLGESHYSYTISEEAIYFTLVWPKNKYVQLWKIIDNKLYLYDTTESIEDALVYIRVTD